MVWVTPKTDWEPANGVADVDFNRIEGNIEHLFNVKVDRAVSETVTVGANGDFQTINAAIEYLSRKRPEHVTSGEIKAEIQLLSGYTMQEQVFVENVDLSWIVITSEASTVTIDRGSLTRRINVNQPPEFTISPAFACFNGFLPIIDVLFVMNASGSASDQSGVFLDNGNCIILPGGGVTDTAFIGLCAINSSNVIANGTDFSRAGGKANVYGDGFRIWASTLTATQSKADDAGDTGFNISMGSKANLNGAQANSCGHHNLLSTSSSIVSAREGIFRNALDDCMVAYAGGVIDARYADVSGAVENYGVIATRSSYINIEGGTANDCGASGIAANRGSVVDATGATANNNGGHNVYAHNASVIVFSEGTATHAGQDNIHANHGSIVNARLATLTNAGRNAVLAFGGVSISVDGADLRNASYRGIEATHGSIVNGQNVRASGAGDRGVLAYANSFIDIDGADVSGAEVRCIEATRGSVINAQNVNASGAGDKNVIAYGASTINLNESDARNAGGNGVECSRGSTINAHDVNTSGAGDTGFVVFNGSIINAGGATGSFSQTVNQITSNGIIFGDEPEDEQEGE